MENTTGCSELLEVASDLSLKIARHMGIGRLPSTNGYLSASAQTSLKYEPVEKSDNKNSFSSDNATDFQSPCPTSVKCSCTKSSSFSNKSGLSP